MTRKQRDPEIVKKIAAANKGNPVLKEAMRAMHARRKASGEDQIIRDKIRKTRIAKGDWLDCEPTEFSVYKQKVRQITSQQPIKTLKYHDLRGRGGYHLDHLVSKKTGFELGFPPEFIGHISNLRFITENANCVKQGYNNMDEITSLYYHLSKELDH